MAFLADLYVEFGWHGISVVEFPPKARGAPYVRNHFRHEHETCVMITDRRTVEDRGFAGRMKCLYDGLESNPSPCMSRARGALEVCVVDPCIDLGRRQLSVADQVLHGWEISAGSQRD